jgi:predicted O-methyltransferase YrrM
MQVSFEERPSEPIDFVFIDGMKMQYADYLQLIRPYCRVGACIIFDDIRAYADKMDTLRDLLKHENIAYTITDLADGDGVLKIIL